MDATTIAQCTTIYYFIAALFAAKNYFIDVLLGTYEITKSTEPQVNPLITWAVRIVLGLLMSIIAGLLWPLQVAKFIQENNK